jgi:hemerythrin-like domain-containing protein
MPVTIGAPREHGFDEPLGLLGDCHRRIERFLDVMIRVVERAAGRALVREEREALETALRYFDMAAPRHTHDEEESLFPRMRASDDPVVRQAMARIDALEADHRQAEAMHAEAEKLCRRWLDVGPLPTADVERLKRILGELRATYARHIAVEDNEVFPLAQRVLSEDQLAQVGREMAGRRGIDGRPTEGARSNHGDESRQ